MHWKSGLSSDWNRQCIFVLASDFLAEYPSCNATLDDLVVLFGRKLQRTRREWILEQTIQTEEIDKLRDEAAKKSRRRGRLHGVCIYYADTLLITDGLYAVDLSSSWPHHRHLFRQQPRVLGSGPECI
jgi:hypothetical protein